MKKRNIIIRTAVAILLTGALLTSCGSKSSTDTGTDASKTSTTETASTTETDSTKEIASTTEVANNSIETKQLSGTLNLYTWDGMFPQEVLDGFEKETGVKINYSNFDYDEDMLAKLEETKGGDYDFVIADDYILEMINKEGLSQKLDTAKLSNISNVNPLFQSQFYDPNNEYDVPYGAGIPLIVYDPALVGFEITSYADLWNPALKDNVAITANYRVINGIALKTLGESFNTNDLDTIQKAGDKLLKLAPNIRIINDNNTQDYLISGEVAAAFLYTAQVNAALKARDDLKVVYPKEGLGFGIMAGFIPSNAPNADAAYAFIDYILRPEVSAKCVENLGYYCTNKAAEEYISEDMKDRLILPDTVTSGEIIQNISADAEELHQKIWDTFKKSCE
jgi:spermidine/putrescine transport system substrate-binding protein